MTAWTVPRRDPVIPPGALHPGLDDTRAGAAHVVQDGDRYRMVYWGSDNASRHYILQAESSLGDPNRWRPRGSPLIGPQPETVYNFHGPGFPFLLPVTESRWLLYFCAWGKPTDGKAAQYDGSRRLRRRRSYLALPLRAPHHPARPPVRRRREAAASGSSTTTVCSGCTTPPSAGTTLGPQGAETGHGGHNPGDRHRLCRIAGWPPLGETPRPARGNPTRIRRRPIRVHLLQALRRKGAGRLRHVGEHLRHRLPRPTGW